MKTANLLPICTERDEFPSELATELSLLIVNKLLKRTELSSSLNHVLTTDMNITNVCDSADDSVHVIHPIAYQYSHDLVRLSLPSKSK